jgi:hypothetical protein
MAIGAGAAGYLLSAMVARRMNKGGGQGKSMELGLHQFSKNWANDREIQQARSQDYARN